MEYRQISSKREKINRGFCEQVRERKNADFNNRFQNKIDFDHRLRKKNCKFRQMISWDLIKQLGKLNREFCQTLFFLVSCGKK